MPSPPRKALFFPPSSWTQITISLMNMGWLCRSPSDVFALGLAKCDDKQMPTLGIFWKTLFEVHNTPKRLISAASLPSSVPSALHLIPSPASGASQSFPPHSLRCWRWQGHNDPTPKSVPHRSPVSEIPPPLPASHHNPPRPPKCPHVGKKQVFLRSLAPHRHACPEDELRHARHHKWTTHRG